MPESDSKTDEKDDSSKTAEAFDPGPWEPPTAASSTILLNEVLGMVDTAKSLLHSQVAELAGEEAYLEYWNKESAS